jgi:hypothetical protein
VDAFPLSEAFAAGNNVGHSRSSFPQDMQIVILKMNQIACSKHFKKIGESKDLKLLGGKYD